jgi:hypothetical protein
MPTPAYLGAAQPTADNNGGSLLGRLGSFFGGVGTPAYSGVGQPTTGGGYLAASAPAYTPAPAPAVADSSTGYTCDDCPIDSDALASGRIAIVIPRDASSNE